MRTRRFYQRFDAQADSGSPVAGYWRRPSTTRSRCHNDSKVAFFFHFFPHKFDPMPMLQFSSFVDDLTNHSTCLVTWGRCGTE